MLHKDMMEEEREDLKERIFFCTSTVDYRLQSTESSMTNKSSADLVHSERCVTVQLSLSLSYLIIFGCSALLLSLFSLCLRTIFSAPQSACHVSL